MKHKQKKKLARKMLTKKEKKDGCSLFLSVAWVARSESKKNKVAKTKEKASTKKKLKEIAS